MAVQTDFMSAINQIAAERNISVDEIIEAIKLAVKTGYKHDYGTGESLIVEVSPDNGSISVFADKKVVEEVTDPFTQITLADAKKIEKKLKVGDHVQIDISPDRDFGRIAAQAARQVIMQKIRESEKESVMSDVVDKIGTIETGVVQRMEGDAVVVEVWKANAVMPLEDRVPGEYYKSGSRIKVLLKEIKKSPRGKVLIVSRAAPEFLGELFAVEIPEIMSGSVEIMGIAREAGSRSKISVRSNQPGVDPIGSCVGQRGVRINSIMDEIKGEKIDIILWDDDIKQYIVNALSPAQVVGVDIDKDTKTAKIVVADDQLSLAIGKDGQNVRLAAKLTGWKIDIQGETQNKEEKADSKVSKSDEKKEKSSKKSEVSELENSGLSAKTAKALTAAGFETVDKVKQAMADGTKIKGIGPKAVEEIKKVLKV